MPTKQQGVSCYDKAELTEPLFVVRGQDYSGPATVGFWVFGNLFLRKRVAEGMKVEVAALELHARVRRMFGEDEQAQIEADDPLVKKFVEALMEAERMERWPVKKLAD